MGLGSICWETARKPREVTAISVAHMTIYILSVKSRIMLWRTASIVARRVISPESARKMKEGCIGRVEAVSGVVQ